MFRKFKIIAALVLFALSAGVLPAQAEESSLVEKVNSAAESLLYLRKELNNRYQIYLNVESTEIELTDKLEPIQLTINTLEDQLRVLEENIRRTKTNIKNIQQRTKAIQLRLIDLFELSEVREVELAQQEDLLAEFIRLAFRESSRYIDWQTGEISTLKFLLSEGTVADVEMVQTYLTVLQETSTRLIVDLQSAQIRYDQVRSDLLESRGRLIVLQRNQLDQEERLTDMQEAKKSLLEKTRGEEREYQHLIEEAQAEQAKALSEISELRNNIMLINSKLSKLENEAVKAGLADLIREQISAGASGMTFPGHTPRLAWPADPSRGITAYYLDPSYEGVFGVAHYAVDFRVRQGTLITAAAPGVVYKAKNNGMGYSYIIIAHPGELMTVYGHISKILIAEGDLVRAGDVIGLSGGTPGTRGAGLMTTGPHLHLEVFDRGEHVDPLDYMPLEQLTAGDIPARYFEAREEKATKSDS